MADAFRIKVTGDKRAIRELKRAERKHRDALAVALYEEAVEIFVESQDEVPVDTGRLRASALVTLEGLLSQPRAIVSYGTDYGLRVHENTDADAGRQARAELALSNPGFKPRGSQVGKSKFLEDPFMRAAPGMATRLAQRVRALVKRGGVKTPTPNVRGKRRG